MRKFVNFVHVLAGIAGWVLFGTLVLGSVTAGAYHLAFKEVVFPRVMMAGIEVTNKNQKQVEEILKKAFAEKPNKTEVFYQGSNLAEATALVINRDYGWAAEQAMNVGRSGNLITRVTERVRIFTKPSYLDLPMEYNADDLDGIIARIAETVNEEGRPSRLVLNDKKEVEFEEGKDSLMVNEEELKKKVLTAISLPGNQKVEVPVSVKSNAVTDEEVDMALRVANYWKDKKLVLKAKDYSLELPIQEVLPLLHFDSGLKELAYQEVLGEVKEGAEREVRNAVFKFENGKVVEFEPETEGLKLKEDQFRQELIKVIAETARVDLDLPMEVTQPTVRAADINNLGIKELIGVGTSLFHGSIPNRIHNLTLASNRLNGVVIAPGETFSMNKALGEVSRATGYREAYVISAGRTVLGDGGGVCQTSTTMFRAAMNAGLPIVERKAHAYRVHYYEDDTGPGYDATIYAPSVDFKFVNDTPAHILIQTSVDQKNLSLKYEFYGTKDGREASISKVKIFSQSGALATVYQDDPTLPAGTLRQVDWSAPGAKVAFDYKVTRNGEVLQDKTFSSSYQPWAAVYLRGTATN